MAAVDQALSDFMSKNLCPAGTWIPWATPIQDEDPRRSASSPNSCRLFIMGNRDYLLLAVLVVPQNSQAIKDRRRVPNDPPGGSQIDGTLELIRKRNRSFADFAEPELACNYQEF